MQNPFQQTQYDSSAHRFDQLPRDEGVEVAFCGRSNAGKSSVINAVTGQKRLARSSKQPGRTQQLNFFTVCAGRRLVDLPGYGYAKVSNSLKAHWHRLINRYLESRHSLAGLVLIVDVRRGLGEQDRQLISWCRAVALPVHVLLNKADKLSAARAGAALLAVRGELGEDVNCQLFSATARQGVEECRRTLAAWMEETIKRAAPEL